MKKNMQCNGADREETGESGCVTGDTIMGVDIVNGTPEGPEQGHAAGTVSGHQVLGQSANSGGDTLNTGTGQPVSDAARVPGTHPLTGSTPNRPRDAAASPAAAPDQPVAKAQENSAPADGNRHSIPAANRNHGDSRQPAAKGDTSPGDRWQAGSTSPAAPSSGIKTAATVQLPQLNWTSGMTMASQMAQRMAAMMAQSAFGDDVSGNSTTRKAFTGNAFTGVATGNGTPGGPEQGHAGTVSGHQVLGQSANSGGDTLNTGTGQPVSDAARIPGTHLLTGGTPNRARDTAANPAAAPDQPAAKTQENSAPADGNRHSIPAANRNHGDSRQPAAKGDTSPGDRWQAGSTSPAAPSSGIKTAATVQLPQLNWTSGMTMASQMAQRMAAVMAQSAQSTSGNGTVSLRIKLQPERLGEVIVRIIYHRGSVQAHFLAANTQTKELLDQSIAQLRENLAQQNINLSDVSTSAGENSDGWTRGGQHFEQNRQNLPGKFSGFQGSESVAGTSQAEQMEDNNDNDHLNHLV